MKVRDILRRLQEGDHDAAVLYLAPYADASDAEEIADLVLVSDEWTCEPHRFADGGVSDVRHPAEGGLSIGRDKTTDDHWPERVVILSSMHGVTRG